MRRIIAVLAVLFIAGCEPASSNEKKKTADLLIGGVFCTTGMEAAYDEPALRGAEVAVDVLNLRGGILGRHVRFVNLDGASDPEVVRRNADQLVKQGAVAIVAPCDFDFGSPSSQVAQRAGVVGISPCASSPLYNSQVLGDKQFTLSMWNTTMGAAAAEYAFKDRGWRTAYVVTDNFLAYTTSLSKYFIEHFKSLGGEVLSEDLYTQGNGDFSKQLARVQEASGKVDLLYVSSCSPDLGMIIRAIRDAGVTLPIVGGDVYDDAELFKLLGETAGNEVYFVAHAWLGAEEAPEVATFITRYKEKHGAPPSSAFAATGWDTVMVLAEAMESAGTTNGAAVAAAMEQKKFQLLSGSLQWSSADRGHAPDKQAAIVRLDRGKPGFIGWIWPENPPAP